MTLNGDRARLPIYEIEADVLGAVRHDRRVVVQAPTGSGKSTQIPQMLVRHGVSSGRIVILQPRRLPTRMLAARVAREMNCALGDAVGYQMRFEDRTRRDTRIVFVTEGLLLRQMLLDPALKGVDTLIFDEFHERHVAADVSLARAIQIQNTLRPDLKILVMSATLDAAGLEDYLSPCRVIRSAGRQYPVTTAYLDRPADPQKVSVWDLAIRELDRVLPDHPEGDVLIFMPGGYEISRTIQALRGCRATKGFEVLPLHGELPADAQDAAVARYDRRKVVVSTNVAETSLTIDGITVVVDSGLARIARFDPNRGINTLFIEKISRASADQRAGRAGRVCPGFCLRLWTEREHAARPDRETPEIRRIDLAETALTLKASGQEDLRGFPWFERPEERALERAETVLADLGAADAEGRITPLGKKLTAFPAHPRYARMLLAADERGCVPSVALMAALMQERSIVLPRQDKNVSERRERRIEDSEASDFVALINAWEYARRSGYDASVCREVGIHGVTARTVERLYESFMDIAYREGLGTEAHTSEVTAVVKCILAGFSDHIACRVRDGSLRCELVHGRRGDLDKESSVRKSRLLVACEVSEIGGGNREAVVKLRLAAAVKPEWLEELFPGDMTEQRTVCFDDSTKRVFVEKRALFRDLVIGRKEAGQPEEAEAATILAEEVMAGRLAMKAWDHAAEQFVARVNLLAEACPELGLRRFGEDDRRAVLREACRGAFSAKDVKDKPVMPALRRWLPAAQQALVEKQAPERITLKNGREAKVVYPAGGGGQPYISQTIQNLYGVQGKIAIAGGRIPLLIHVLAPNQRPVQVTQDLSGFWKDHYPRVKKELQRRYPKHEWR